MAWIFSALLLADIVAVVVSLPPCAEGAPCSSGHLLLNTALFFAAPTLASVALGAWIASAVSSGRIRERPFT
jgi:hypothetical protein